MPIYLTKLSKFGGQYRVTIPKGLIQEVEWEDVEYVILEGDLDRTMKIRRFVDAESLRGEAEEDPAG